MHSTQIHSDHTPKLTFFNIVIVNLQFAVAQTAAILNENHNKKMYKNDLKHTHLIMKDCHQWCEKGVFGMTGRPRGATK